MALKPVEILITARDNAKSVIDKLRNSATSLAKSLRGVKPAAKQAEDAEKSLKNTTNSLSNSFKTAAVRIGAFVGATLILRKIKDGFLEIINTGGRFEILNKQLAAVMGTVEGGEAAFAWIKEFARTTPLQLEEVTKAFVTMKAFGLDPMDGTMQKLVDISTKLGGGQDRLRGIVLGVGQAWTKQKLQAEEANQLIERGVPVWELLAKQMGLTTKEVIKLSESGAIGRKEIAGLIDAIGESSVGAAADQMSTLVGITSNLKDTFTRFLDSIAQSGVLDHVKDQLQALSDTIQGMAEDGSLAEWARHISETFVAVSDVIGIFSDTIRIAFNSVQVAATGVLDAVVNAAADVNAALASITFGDTSAEFQKNADNMRLFSEQLRLSATEDVEQIKESYNSLAEKFTSTATVAKSSADVVVKAEQDKAKEVTAANKLIEESAEKVAGATKTLKTDLASLKNEATTAGINAAKAFTDIAESAELTKKQLSKAAIEAIRFAKTSGDIEVLKDALEDAGVATGKFTEVGIALRKQVRQLDENELSGLGVSLEQIKGGLTDFGAQAVGAFNRLAQSASLTKKQLTSVAVQLVATAKTKGDIEALKNTFRAAGIATGAFSQVGQVLEQQLIKINQAAGITENAIDDLANSYREAGAAQISSEQEVEDAAEEAAEDAKARASALSAILDGLKNRVREYGEAWVDTFNQQRVSTEGGLLFFERLGKAANDTIAIAKQFNKEAVKNAESLQLMAEGGAASADQLEIMRNLMQESLKDADKLSDANLDKLKNSLAAANQQLGEMAAFSKSAADTLTTLKNNLDQLNDNDAAIEQRKLQEERLKLEEDLQEARRRGNQEAAADLQDSIGLLNEINTIKQQNIAIEKLTTIGISESAQELTAMRDIMEDTLNSSQQLSQANVDKLKDSIERANRELEKMNDFADSASDKLDSLKDEWDRLNDNQAAIDQRQFQQDRLELEAELQTARQEGNEEALKDLQASLSLLTKINQKKQQNNALDAISSTTETTSSPAVTPAAPQPPSASTRTVNIEFVNGNTNRTINAAFDSQNEADEFLEILKQMGTVT